MLMRDRVPPPTRVGHFLPPLGPSLPLPGPRIRLSRSVEGEAICHLQEANQMCLSALWPLHHLSASCEGTTARTFPGGPVHAAGSMVLAAFCIELFMLDSFESSRQNPRPCPGYITRPLCRVFTTYGFRILGSCGMTRNSWPTHEKQGFLALALDLHYFFGVWVMYTD